MYIYLLPAMKPGDLVHLKKSAPLLRELGGYRVIDRRKWWWPTIEHIETRLGELFVVLDKKPAIYGDEPVDIFTGEKLETVVLTDSSLNRFFLASKKNVKVIKNIVL